MYHLGAGPGALPPATFAWATLRPGDSVILGPGDYPESIVVSARGTPAGPIVILAEPGTELACSIVLMNASHVFIDGLTITRATGAGIVLTRGAAYNRVMNTTVRDGGLGVLFREGGGPGNVVEHCTLEGNLTHGIAADRFSGMPAAPCELRDNIVSRNGFHGVEVNGNHFRVERNQISDNGSGIAGTSGIHLFTRSRTEGLGRHNLVRGNVVWGQRESTGQDGNGIQVDTWCDDNVVSFNAAFGNEGAGIHLYDASVNRVANNTLVGNMARTDSLHVLRGELVIASDETRHLDHAHGNVIVNNIAVATQAQSAAVAVHRTMTSVPGAFAGNIWWRTGTGPLWRWAGRDGDDIAAWNRLRPGAADRHVDPGLAQLVPDREVTPALAFRPARSPALAGFPGQPHRGETDLTGQAAQPGLTGAFMPPP